MFTYIRIAFLALLAAAVATALFYRGQSIAANAVATQLRSDLATAASVNKQNQQTIAVLRDDLLVSSALAKDLADQVEQIDRDLDAANDELQALKDADNEVSSYLTAPVPLALQRLYDRKANGAGAN